MKFTDFTKKLGGPCTNLVLNGVKSGVKKASQHGLGGRLVRAIPVGLALSVLFVALIPTSMLIDRIAKPILKSANILKNEQGNNFSRKHKVAAWALMLPKLVATIPAAAIAAVIVVVVSPILVLGLPFVIATGQGRSFMN